MTRLETRVDTSRPKYATRRDEWLALVDEVEQAKSRVRAHGEARREKFHAQGRLLPRERVDALLDPGQPFLELSELAGFKMHDDNGRNDTFGGGNIVGIGVVSGVRCVITANDSAIKGGTVTPMGLEKTLRAQRIALENRLPVIALVESGGANLLYQAEIFVKGGEVFRNMARLSAAGIPQITVVHGSSTAGGAYVPGLSDVVIAVEGRAKIFLAGPPLVKAAIGEEVSEEDLGGAAMHASVTGLADHLARDDAHAIELAREVVDSLMWPRVSTSVDVAALPHHDPEEICGAIPADPRMRWDPRELIARLVDDSEFLEFKANYGTDTVCGHAKLHGHALGVVANAGPIQPAGSNKVTHFIQLCCQTGVPLVYLQNTTGYMIGREAEHAGAIKHGAKMIQAVANANVPQLTVIVGGGYGAGNYGMCGRAFEPRFLFAWPNARVAVMGGDQAAGVMELITRAKHERRGLPLDEDALAQMKAGLAARLESESKAIYASARVWDDGIIDPRQTRDVLGLCLSVCAEAQAHETRTLTFGVARP